MLHKIKTYHQSSEIKIIEKIYNEMLLVTIILSFTNGAGVIRCLHCHSVCSFIVNNILDNNS